MAGYTGEVPGFVRAPSPQDPIASLVALQADRVFLGGGQGRFLCEADVEGWIGQVFQVLAAWAVAGLASPRLEIALGQLRPQELAVERVFELSCLVGVAALAGLA